MHQTLQQLGLLGIIPVIAIEDAGDAEPLAQALIEGGLPCAEVTFRTSVARESIARMTKAFPSMLVGAGTVLNIDQAKRAVDSGARFIVSPGLNPPVVEYCAQHGIPITPGVVTPTEVQAALELGLEVVKLFPAEAIGGIEYLKALSAPFRQIWFIPTGGISESNFVDYLKAPRVFACGGSWMVKTDLISAKRFDEIGTLVKRAIAKMLDFQVSVPASANAGAAGTENVSTELARILHVPVGNRDTTTTPGSRSLQAEPSGTQDRISISTNFIERAMSYCSAQGIGVIEGTKKEINGRLASATLDVYADGYAVQLLQSG